jgi:uncharacterized membrane-anchored protein
MARQVKTLFNNPNERSHRDHRSKKNRKHIHKSTKALLIEKKKEWEDCKVKELEDEIKNY